MQLTLRVRSASGSSHEHRKGNQMMKTISRLVRLCGVFGLVWATVNLIGCGGGGGGGVGSVASGVADVFVTDTFRDDFRQVLVTVFKVEGSADGTTFQTLFDDANGQAIDVAALADSTLLLARASVSGASLTQLRVTIGDRITVVPRGGGPSSSLAMPDNVGTAAGSGKRAVTFPVTTDASGNLVVDFDLASFQMEGGRVRPVIRSGDPAQFIAKRHGCRLAGTVANLVAGASFDLQGPQGRSLHVVLTGDTTISTASGAVATLANSQRVFVEGDVDRTTKTITATAIRIDDRAQDGNFQAAGGAVASVNSGSGSFTLTVAHAHHFSPTGGTITVQTDSNTIFRKARRETASISDIAANGMVLVGGTFNDSTQTLTAKFVHIR